MFGAEHFLADRKRALEERSCRRKVALITKHPGELVERRRNVGMLGAEHFLADRKCPLQERPCPRKVALGLEQQSEVIARPRGVFTPRSQRLPARQRAFCESAETISAARRRSIGARLSSHSPCKNAAR